MQMKFTTLSLNDGFIFTEAQVSYAEHISDDLILNLRNTAADKHNPQNSYGFDMYMTEPQLTLRSFSLKKATAAERHILDDDFKKAKRIKEHTLYKSEYDKLIEKLCAECSDIFSLSSKCTDESTLLELDLCFHADGSIYTLVFECTELILSWDGYSSPTVTNKPSLRERAERLRLDIPAVLLALRHKDTPRIAKLLSAIAIGYALSPIDLIPDFIPVLGYLDDVLILPGLLYMAIRLIPDEVMSECRRRAAGLQQSDAPKKWYYSIPIILFWLVILVLIVFAIF